MSVSVSAVFAHQDVVLRVIDDLKRRSVDDIDVMMPVPDHEIIDALPAPPTKIGWIFSIWGGLFGVLLGFLGPAWTHQHIYAQITGGKPVISWPPFVVPGFEMMILFTGLITFTGVIVLGKLPRRTLDPHFDPRVTEDRYVIVVETSEERAAEIAGLLRAAGGEVR